MRDFSEFGIEAPPHLSFVGQKIDVRELVNRKIEVHAYRVEDSKYQTTDGDEKCLHLQIVFKQQKRVVFVGANTLIDMIERVPKEEFPFSTTITDETGRLEFS